MTIFLEDKEILFEVVEALMNMFEDGSLIDDRFRCLPGPASESVKTLIQELRDLTPA
jgi:hypothetical protein